MFNIHSERVQTVQDRINSNKQRSEDHKIVIEKLQGYLQREKDPYTRGELSRRLKHNQDALVAMEEAHYQLTDVLTVYMREDLKNRQQTEAQVINSAKDPFNLEQEQKNLTRIYADIAKVEIEIEQFQKQIKSMSSEGSGYSKEQVKQKQEQLVMSKEALKGLLVKREDQINKIMRLIEARKEYERRVKNGPMKKALEDIQRATNQDRTRGSIQNAMKDIEKRTNAQG